MSMDEETSNDLKKAGGYLKEKIAIGLTRWNDDELERAVIKVTSHKLKAPNEKHMARLLAATFGSYKAGKNEYENANAYIVNELEKKTHVHNWVVLLKTLVVLHKLMKEGSNEVNLEIQRNVNLFCMRHMKDVADTPEGAAQAGFIQQYTRYLEERSVAQSALRLSFRIESTDEMHSAIDAMSLEQRTVAIEALLLQMEVLSQIEFRENFVDNFATLEAFKMVADDGKRLYVILTRGIMYIIDRFFDLSVEMKKVWIGLYSKYTRATSGLKHLFTAMNDSRTVVFEERYPTLEEMPASVLLDLEEMCKPPVAVVKLSAIAPTSAGMGGASREISPQSAAAVASAPAPPAAVTQHKQSLDLFQEFEKTAAAQSAAAPTAAATVGAVPPPLIDFGSPQAPSRQSAPASAPPPPPAPRSTLDDIFAPAPVTTTAAPPTTQRPAAPPSVFDPFAAVVAPTPVQPAPQPVAQQPQSIAAFDPFAPVHTPVPAAVVQQHSAPVMTPPQQSRAPVAAPAAGGGFDPFAAMDTKPAPSAPTQPMDFFQVPTSSVGPSRSPPPQPQASQPVYTADGRARAW